MKIFLTSILCLFISYTYADMSNQQLTGQWKITKYLTTLSTIFILLEMNINKVADVKSSS